MKTVLELGMTTVDVASDAGKAIADLLTIVKAEAVRACQERLDPDSRAAIHNDLTYLRSRLETIVYPPEFNRKNLITNGATDLKVVSTVEARTICVSAQVIDATTIQWHEANLSTPTPPVRDARSYTPYLQLFPMP